jgi:hypothetical protein
MIKKSKERGKDSNKKKTKSVSNKRKFFYIQIVLTLLVAGFLILSGNSDTKVMTGNAIGSGEGGSSNASFNIFLFIGIGIGFFVVIEIVILLVTAYF